MDKIRVGVIGCGKIGCDHIRRLMTVVPETTVVAVADYYKPAAEKVAEQYGIACCETGEELIDRSDVDCVVITSTDPTHAAYALNALQHKKYVFCEKPLAMTAAEGEEIIKAELAAGKRLLQVGFMRHYDPGYAKMKEIIDSGKIGAPLMIHAAHRNVSQGPGFQTDNAVTNIAIHETDICRWLLNDEYEEVQVLDVRQTKNTKDWANPQIMTYKTKSGQRIDVEVQTSEGYAYDIQCQVVCEDGVVNLPDPYAVNMRANATYSFPILTDWTQRFVDAYDIEFKDFAKSIAETGSPKGPSAWDGYVACVTSDAMIKSRKTGHPEKVITIEKPDMYK